MIMIVAGLGLAACSDAVPTEPSQASAAELQSRAIDQWQPPLLVFCKRPEQREEARNTLARAQFLGAAAAQRDNALPSGCTVAVPPQGSVPVFIARVPARDGRPVYLVDMFYPSNPDRAWYYIAPNRDFSQSYFDYPVIEPFYNQSMRPSYPRSQSSPSRYGIDPDMSVDEGQEFLRRELQRMKTQ